MRWTVKEATMQLEDVPGRVLLDTCVVNFLLDHGEQIHDGVTPTGTGRVVGDVEALRRIWITGRRANWQLAMSPHTYYEVAATSDPHRRQQLENWFGEIWAYWRQCLVDGGDLPTLIEAENLRINAMACGALDILPDFADRVLVCDALVYRCELFCTRDWTTILKHRESLQRSLRLEIVTPSEWWCRIQPFAALWA